MGNQKLVLCDTNIIIEFYKSNAQIVSELKTIGQENIAISAITVGELIYGAFNKKELNQILKDSKHLKLLHVNDRIGQIFIQLMTDYSLSHNLTLPDAILAATAIHFEVPLYTLNLKDFRYIDKLKIYQTTN